MGRLRKFLGKLLGNEGPAPAPAHDPAAPGEGRAGPLQPDPAIESQRRAEDAESAHEHPEQALSSISDIRYISEGGTSETGVKDGAAGDRLVLVYNGQDLVFEVGDDMRGMAATDFVPRLIEQAYERYEILFDTDDIFQIMILLRTARPEEQR